MARARVRIIGILSGLLAVSPAAAQTAPGSETLLPRLTELAAQFAGGGTPVGTPRSGELGEGQEKRIGVHLDEGKCYVFVAVGAPELEDLDLALDAAGERLGEDTQPDNYPVVRACTPIAVRVEVVLAATRGAGSYVLGQYAVSPSDEEAYSLGMHAAGDLAPRIEALAGRHCAQGRLAGEVYRGRLIVDDVAAISPQLQGGRCYSFFAVGGAGVEDVNLAVSVGSQGVGDDTGPGSEAVVADFCPSRAVTATVRVTMVRGSGDFVFAAWSREASPDELTEIATVDTTLLTRRLTERAAAVATGMRPAQSPHFGSLRAGRSENITFPVTAGNCYRVVGVTEPGIDNLDLTLFLDGSQVAEDVEPGATPVVGTCAPAAGTARLDIWAVDGGGGYGIGVYSGGQPTTGTEETNPLFQLLDAAAAALAPGATRASQPFSGVLSVMGTQQYDISLGAGKCYAFVGVADAGNLDIEITSGTSTLGSDTDLDTTPGVLYCAQAAMSIRAKLTLLSASGNFAFGVYNAPAVGSTTTARPTATGIAVGGPETDYIANQIRQIHGQRAAALLPVSQVNRGNLQQAQESEFLVNLPAGRCYTIIAAGVPSVRDMDITLTSPYGQILATDTTDDAVPMLVTNPCPQWSGDYRIKVLMQYGYGAFGFQVFSQ